MNRYENLFSELAKKKQGAFIPFVVLLDPDLDISKKIIEKLIISGADALELGIAFSDPVADGPVIQKASMRVLKNKCRVQDSFKLISQIRKKYPDIPMGVLTYSNIIFKLGIKNFYTQAKLSGLDSILIADVPICEIKKYSNLARLKKLDQILIAPPNLPVERISALAKFGSGYTYLVTRSGVTGENNKINLNHQELIMELKKHSCPPPIFGFGISKPDHVTQALQEGARGVISGSKIVSIIQANLEYPEIMLEKIGAFVTNMKSACKNN